MNPDAPATEQSATARLRRDVDALCATPRHRDLPGSMERARGHCRSQLEAAGWRVEEQEFHPRSALRISDAGYPGPPLAMKWAKNLTGVNLLAYDGADRDSRAGDILLMAHLDTVRSSIGADDNASGVAVALEVARQLRGRRHNVVIALVDLEELWHLGARHIAKTMPKPGLVVCMDAVGYYDDQPRSQRGPAGFALMFPTAAREIAASDRRGDFLLAAFRRNSEAFTRLWARHAAAAGLRSVLLRDRRWNGHGQRITHWGNPLLMDLDRSDHEPFWRRSIPAVILTGTATMRSPHYHRASDHPDTLDYARLEQLADSLTSSLLEHGDGGIQ